MFKKLYFGYIRLNKINSRINLINFYFNVITKNYKLYTWLTLYLLDGIAFNKR